MTLSLALLGPPGTVPVGRPAGVHAQLRNDGPDEVWVVGVLDGSETGTRYPLWRPTVERDGVVVAAPGPAEDPLVGPLRAEDFHRLAAGETFAAGRLATFALFAPAEPGDYRYRLELSTESPSDADWLGRFNQAAEVAGLVRRVPRLTLSAGLVVPFR
ncbi:hypothetical protein C8N24_4791 [Solirubrobacter pauli]|uniref:Uncharacterized protein n=1 Tax=Solirubrobacter pauli TaxID=166793 RepID=A0A660KYQ9_9ACTN|nr:hypothetical protein [Solirubrobacter pauli]RKQ86776.1 hypothetical protein C8N24_4791 [Solirubrobacter pauli]